MENFNQEHELYHHGVKGMKWGVRRFQKKNGTLTPAGKKRYNYDTPDGQKKKSKHRLRLEEQFRKSGMSQKEAELAANKRIRTERILMASAALTVTACAAYMTNKKLKERVDGVIKAGEKLQRIEMTDTGGKLYDTFYASKGKHDNKRYKGLLGMTRQMQMGKAYTMHLEASKDIKVASKDKAAKVFGDLYKNDPDFKKSVENYVSKHFTGKNKVKNIDKLSDKNIKKMYENFNSGLLHIRSDGSGADKKFYDKLKSSGYGAIQDINDMKFSGYHAKNPLIIFDNSNNNVMVKSMKEIDKSMAASGTRELLKAACESTLESIGPVSAAALTGVAAKTYASDPTNNTNQQFDKI